MNELELRENLSNKTVDVLVETVIRLLRHITLLEMKVHADNEDKKGYGSIVGGSDDDIADDGISKRTCGQRGS